MAGFYMKEHTREALFRNHDRSVWRVSQIDNRNVLKAHVTQIPTTVVHQIRRLRYPNGFVASSTGELREKNELLPVLRNNARQLATLSYTRSITQKKPVAIAYSSSSGTTTTIRRKQLMALRCVNDGFQLQGGEESVLNDRGREVEFIRDIWRIDGC